MAKAGFDVLVSEGIRKIGLFIVLSPLTGFVLALLLMLLVSWLFVRANPRNPRNRFPQLLIAIPTLRHLANVASPVNL